MSKKEKPKKFYTSRVCELLVRVSEAGFIQWKPTDDPPVRQNYDEGNFRGEWRGYETKIGTVTVRTVVRFKKPGKNDHDLVWVLEILGEGFEKITVSTDPKVIPGFENADGYIGHFCERIHEIVEDKSLVATLTRELLRMLHPA